ncbi:MAG: Ig domain-containing protein group 2 domain-containing protein, partial [bacterium]
EPLGSGVDGPVRAVAELNGSLFLGGEFGRAGDSTSERIARWDDGLVTGEVGAPSIRRGESRVELAWSVAGPTNLSSFEVWVSPVIDALLDTAEPPPEIEGPIGRVAPGLSNDFEFVDSSARATGAGYWLRELGPFNDSHWFGPYLLEPLPPGARLGRVTPNPFREAAAIHYSLAVSGRVHLQILDAQGRLIRTLHDGVQSAGVYSVPWDGRLESGSPAASGAYWARLATDTGIQSRQLIRLR